MYLIHDCHSPFCRKKYIPMLVWCHLYPIQPLILPLNLTYILTSYFETFIRDPALYKLLTFHMPNLISILLLRSFIQIIRLSVRLFLNFRNNLIFCGKRRLPRAQPPPPTPDGGLPVVSCRGCLFIAFRSTLHS
jgi:hypothetical protein